MFSGKIEDYILFEDKEIIVCRKPAGIAVQNARIGAMDLESSLKNYLAMQAGGGRRIPYLAVIHRLDQPDINGTLWSDLFLLNKEPVIEEIERLETQLERWKKFIWQ